MTHEQAIYLPEHLVYDNHNTIAMLKANQPHDIRY